MLKEYLVRYRIDREATFGVAVVVAKDMNRAISLLNTQGSYNGVGYQYQVTEVTLINDTDKYNTESILEEISTSAGYSAYEIAKKYGYTGSEEEWLNSLKGETGQPGPIGPQGPRGYTGQRGEKGDKGIKGDKGDKGDMGIQGPQGNIGPQGPQGPQGVQGPKGNTGPKGATGEQGPRGPQGPEGKRGDVGPKGEKGDKGDPGIQGQQGPRGLTGPQGIRGQKGDTGDIRNLCRKITYVELLDLKNREALSPGAYYRITDYETTTSQSSTQSAKHPYDIIVQALDPNTLSENAQSIQREGDSYFAKANLNAWRLKYSLDNDKNRFAWAKDAARDQLWKCEWGVLESKANNDASTNYEQATIDGQLRYLYRPSKPTLYLEGKQFYREVASSAITSTEGFRYEADSEPYYNEEDDYYDFPSEIRVKTASGSLVAVFTLEDYNTYYDEADYADMMEYPISFSDSYTEEDGVYYLVPESGIDSWWEGFIGGEKVETERVYYNGSVGSLYYAFGSILPKSSKSVTEVTDKIHIYQSDDIIDTVSYQSYVSPEDGGKGVVYWMIDEWGNECRYDFKNIQFKDGTSFYYTFGSTDQSLAGTSYENIIDVCNGKRLAVVIFKNRAIGNRFTSRSMQSAIFGNICERNVLDATSGTLTKITSSDPLYSNYIGGNIGGTLTTQGQMTGCTIRGNNNGSFKGVFLYCDFFGRGSLALTDSNGNMKMARGIRVAFPVGSNANVKLTSDKTASSTTPVCENIELQASNFSTSQVVIPIDNYYGNTAMLKIAKNSSGVVKIWHDADLIQ